MQPWDDLPTEPNGDPDPDQLFHAVGYATTAWERLDESLSGIFAELAPSAVGQTFAAFGFVSSSATRSSMILTASAYIFHKDNPVRAKIETLVAQVGNLSGKRNNIVHGVVTKVDSAITGPTGTTRSAGYYLLPAFYMTRKVFSPHERMALLEQDHEAKSLITHKYAYTSQQVLRFASTFEEYARRAVDLQEEVEQERELMLPSPERRVRELEQKLASLQTKLKAQ